MDITSLLLFSALAIGTAVPTESARSAVMNSYLKQSGIEDNVTRYGAHYEKQIPEDARIYLGYSAYLTKVVVDKYITVKWSF